MALDHIEVFDLDSAKVHKLALELGNPRQTPEQKGDSVRLPKMKYAQDFKRRALTGGPLSFIEAKAMVREQLTFGKWKATFYEVVQFPQILFFETEFQALKFFKRATVYGKGARGGKLMAQRLEIHAPADHIFGGRRSVHEWKSAEYKPDPLITSGYR